MYEKKRSKSGFCKRDPQLSMFCDISMVWRVELQNDTHMTVVKSLTSFIVQEFCDSEDCDTVEEARSVEVLSLTATADEDGYTLVFSVASKVHT